MGTLINALKEIFSSSQTSPTNIPTCASDGTPNGNVNMANLVATLGGGSTETLIDANVLRPFRFVYVTSPSRNCPNNQNGYIYTFRRMASSDNGYYQQFYFVYNGSSNQGMWYRQCVEGTWSSWKKISTDIPDFYKSYNDLSSLASALGGVISWGGQGPLDINTIEKTSFYAFLTINHREDDNWPDSEGGICITICPTSTYRVQLFFNYTGSSFYYRIYWENMWYNWKQVTITT